MGNKSSKKQKLYAVPPGAGRPSACGQPQVDIQDAGVFLYWMGPKNDGGCPMIGYIVQHSNLDEGIWHSSNPIKRNECIVENLNPGSTYQFRVIGENLLGFAPPSPASEPIIYTTELVPPSFITRLNNVAAIENEKVEFRVQVTGRPQPITKWFLNEESLESTDDESILVEVGRVIFRRVSNRFEGEVKCVAYNELGSAESSATLTVGAPPRILEDSSKDFIFQVDELLRVKFTFSGRPTPEVTWFHNGVPITDNIETIGTTTSLKIPHASRSHRGEYSVRLENNLGVDTAGILVTVADKPRPPTVPTVVLLRDNSAVLEWKDGEDDGGCPVQCYIVEYFRSGWDVWLTGATSRAKAAKIRDLIPGSKYKFRIKAENLYGLSEASGVSVEIFIPDLSVGLMSSVAESEEENEPKAQQTAGTGPETSPNVRSLKPEIRSVKPEIRNRSPEARSLKPEIRNRSPELQSLSTGIRSLSAGIRGLSPETRSLEPEISSLKPEIRSLSPDIRNVPARPEISSLKPESRSLSPDIRNVPARPEISSLKPEIRSRSPDIRNVAARPEIRTQIPATRNNYRSISPTEWLTPEPVQVPEPEPPRSYPSRAELRKAIPSNPNPNPRERSPLLFDHYNIPRGGVNTKARSPSHDLALRYNSLPRAAVEPTVDQPDLVKSNSLTRQKEDFVPLTLSRQNDSHVSLSPSPSKQPGFANLTPSRSPAPSQASRSSSVSSSTSHLIYEEASSSEEDLSTVTQGSLTVLRSGKCEIQTSRSKEELNGSTNQSREELNWNRSLNQSRDELSRSTNQSREDRSASQSQQELDWNRSTNQTREELNWNRSTNQNEEELSWNQPTNQNREELNWNRSTNQSEEELNWSQEAELRHRSTNQSKEELNRSSGRSSLNSADMDYYSSIFGKARLDGDSADEDDGMEASIEAERVPEPEGGGGWGPWRFLLIPIFLGLFIKFTLYTNVGVMVYVLYRLLRLFFD